jgi:hypothetical protein
MDGFDGTPISSTQPCRCIRHELSGETMYSVGMIADHSPLAYCGRGKRAFAAATRRPQEMRSGEQSSRSMMHSISVGPA